MKLSTKGRYGARAMLDIALNHEEGPVSLKDLAQRQDLSIKYLEQLIQPLKTAGLVKSIRGAGGGYTLARPTDEINLLQIVQALEKISPVDCLENPEICHRANKCVAHDIWKKVKDSTDNILAAITLENMVDRQLKKSEEP